MQFFIYATIIIASTFGFLVSIGILPSVLKFGPEIMAMMATVVFVTLGVRERFRNVRAAYWLIFGALALVFVCSSVANQVGSGPTFAGIRNYVRAIPFFFLPAVLSIQRVHVKRQLLLMLLIAVIQLPIAWFQRTHLPSGAFTGDYTTGTMMNSGVLSIILIACGCVITACYLRKEISLKFYLAMLLLILLPTTLNETKATVFLLPVGLLTVFFLAHRGSARLVAVFKGVIVLAIFASIFVPVYDYYVPEKDRILTFLSDPEAISRYNEKGADVGDTDRVGRIDSITMPLRAASNDPVRLFFGYGPGNVSDSALGDEFTGLYFARFGPFLITLWSVVVFELGLFGFGLLVLLMWCIFRDSLTLAREGTGLVGALGLGWCGVICVMLFGFFYKTLISNEGVSFLFWYFSGLVVALRMQLVQHQQEQRMVPGQDESSSSHSSQNEISFGWRRQQPQ